MLNFLWRRSVVNAKKVLSLCRVITHFFFTGLVAALAWPAIIYTAVQVCYPSPPPPSRSPLLLTLDDCDRTQASMQTALPCNIYTFDMFDSRMAPPVIVLHHTGTCLPRTGSPLPPFLPPPKRATRRRGQTRHQDSQHANGL